MRYVLDRLLAIVILVVMSPVMGAIAVVLLVANGRPVLFRQPRVGRHGEVFFILKFRTMVIGAEQAGGGYTERQNLITPTGRRLRRSSLDELPQLINIIRGEMAMIGPRPSLIGQYERYTEFQRRRTEALPGITGLAQVTYRDDAPWSKRIMLDVEYIDRASPVLDLKIVLRTVTRVVTGAGVRSDQTRGQVDDLG
jgi:lipopolysaccharide/colanic/teichoic acid biosynthesis glycosyltransferase